MVTKKQMVAAENERELVVKEKMTAKSWLILIFGILVASIVRAISIHIFVVPNNFAPGGVTGLSSILEYITHWNAGYFLVACNVPLIVIAWIFIGKRFACVSGIAIVLSSVLMIVTEKLMPNLKFEAVESGERILAAIAGGILGGVGISIMLKIGGSSGGTDIIATIIQRKNSATNVAWFIFMLDSTVVLASAFVYDNPMVPILLSFVEMFVSSKVVETILQGFKSALKFEIITNHPEELSQDILHILHRGVTSIPAKGMYTGEERAMLICVLRKRQLSQFRLILKKYPDSFAYMSGTSEVVGRGFNS